MKCVPISHYTKRIYKYLLYTMCFYVFLCLLWQTIYKNIFDSDGKCGISPSFTKRITQKLHVFQKIDLFGFNSGDDSQLSTNCLIFTPNLWKAAQFACFSNTD